MLRALLLVALAALLAGCAAPAAEPAPPGPGDGPLKGAEGLEPRAPPIVAHVRTRGAFPASASFDPTVLEGKSGWNMTVEFRNEDATPLVQHTWTLDGVDGATTPPTDPGSKNVVTFTLPAPGEYVYYCAVGDHRARGLEGTLLVKPAA